VEISGKISGEPRNRLTGDGRNGRLALALMLLVFLLPRLFVSSPYYFVSLDEAKYLSLAASFPSHTLFNKQFYVVHPPLFPAFIRLVSVILPDHTAGILVSFAFSLLSFAVIVRLFRTLGKDPYWIAVALFPLAVSPLHIPTSRVVYKDSMFFGLFLLSLYFFIRGLILVRPGLFLWSAGAGMACALTSDLAVCLYPGFFFAWLVFRRRGRRGGAAAVPPLMMGIVQGAWLLLRYRIFSRNDYYPAGVDGTIEYVRAFTLRSLLAPRYFPETVRLFDFRLDLTRLGLHGNVYPLEGLVGLPHFLYVAFYVVCALSAVWILISSRVTVGAPSACIPNSSSGPARSGRRNGSALGRASHNESIAVSAIRRFGTAARPGIFFSALLVVYSLPALLHPEPRFLIPVLLPLCYLFAEGISLAAGKGMRYAAAILIVISLLGTAGYLDGHRHPALAARKEVESSRTAEFLKGLSEDGIMAQVGYPPELAYLTGKRVLALPLSPEKLDDFIRRYDIHYLVYGQHYWAPIDERFARAVWCYPTIKYIRDHPARYPLIGAIDENYRSGEKPDRIFIHAARQMKSTNWHELARI